MEYRDGHVATLETNPVGPTVITASAAKVPTNGAVPAENAVPPSELTFVNKKLAPVPPSWYTRLRLFVLGACILNARSLSRAIDTLPIPTVTSAIVAPAGIPVTLILFVAPVALLSGTANAPVDENVVVILVPATVGAVSI